MALTLRSPSAKSTSLAVRLVVAVAIFVGCIALGRSSSAEFELPFISSTDALTSVSFHSVWAQNRGRFGQVGYEAYAVGENLSPGSSCTGDTTKCNGAVYIYKNATWSHVSIPYQIPSFVQDPINHTVSIPTYAPASMPTPRPNSTATA